MDNIKGHIRNRIRFTAAVILLMAAAVLMTGNVYAASGGWETEENNSISDADHVNVNQIYHGSINDYDDCDYYCFTTTNDGTISITFNHDYINSGDNYWRISLRDKGNEQILSWAITGDEESIETREIGLPADTYYVLVDSWDGSFAWNNAPYKISVIHEQSSVCETEYNDNRTIADEIEVNETYYGNINDYDDADYYRLTTTVDGTIGILFNHDYINDANNYWHVSIRDETGKQILGWAVTGDDDSIETQEIGLPAGTYYVLVDSWDGSFAWDDSPYSITVTHKQSSVWETEYNDNRTIADEMSVNKTYYGRINDYNDTDYYRITTTTDGTIGITFNHDYVDSSKAYWKISIHDIDDEKIKSWVISGNMESKETCKIGLPAGTYYVLVDSYDGSFAWNNSLYNITANHEQSFVWETEYNDNRTIADDVSLGTRYYGNSMDSSDKDYYTFDLPKKTKLNFNFEHPYIDEDDYWKVAISDKDEATVNTAYISGTKESTSWELGYLAAGKYYVYVTPYDHSTQTYSFQIDENKMPYGTYIKSAKGKKKAVVLSWQKSSDAQGYEIYRSMKKGGTYKKVKTITSKNTVKYTNKKLKKGKRYYYKIRSYKVVDDTKYYSAFSSVKSAKAK